MKIMPISPQVKEFLGPAVSVFGAVTSLVVFGATFRLSREVANRSIYVDGQKFLIEICKLLMSEPLLWCVYDSHPFATLYATEVESALFQARLVAFAHLHLNMFEIVLTEAPNPKAKGKRHQSEAWIRYFENTLRHSSAIRSILEEPETSKIWSKALMDAYVVWKEQAKA